jgi:starch-binding outer membrane protein, SusD/RagB family
LNIPNSIRAYRARYLRLTGNHLGAVTASNAVDRRVFSVLPFSDQVRNPVNTLSSGSSGVLPRDAFRLAAAPGDGRVAFHVEAAALTGRIGTPVDNFARYRIAASSIPTYYPDEVLLIKAEALANLDQLAEAQAVLDSVRTDCPGLVPDDPNACLPALGGPLSKAALLAEIYVNRRFELFATGLRWEDTRRLGLVGAGSAGKRCWLLYTIGERNANPANVPPDPEGSDAPAFPANCF